MELNPTTCRLFTKCLSKPNNQIGLFSKIKSIEIAISCNNVPSSCVRFMCGDKESWPFRAGWISSEAMILEVNDWGHSFLSNFSIRLIMAVIFGANSVTLLPFVELFLAANPTSFLRSFMSLITSEC